MDSFTEVTRRSWGGRIGNAFKGVGFGLLLVVVSFPLLFINEGRAVKTRKALDEGARVVVSVAADRLDPANEGRLVHVSGPATGGSLSDPDFGVAATALALQRKVEMFQWKESKSSRTVEKLGGGEETRTTYTYTQTWSDRVEASARFKEPAGHENPAQMPVAAVTRHASDAKLGAFLLPVSVLDRLDGFEPLAASAGPEALPNGARPHADGFYLGPDPAHPRVGDARITFRRLPEGPVSVVARQSGDTFTAYTAQSGRDLLLVDSGLKSAAMLFADAQASNRLWTWLLRLGGFVLMFLGTLLVLNPLKVLGSVVPLLGSLIGLGTGFAAFIGSLVCSSLVIAAAWIFYRPLFAIALLVAVAALVFVAVRRRRTRMA
jgi:hypothetical protein